MLETAANVPEQSVLVVEDLEDTRTTTQQLLAIALKITVDTAVDGQHALKLLKERHYSVVVTDLRMPKMSGMQLIEEIKQRGLPTTTIVISGHGTISDAVNAMHHGAYDYLTKPVDPQHLCLLVERALRERRLRDEVIALRQQLGDSYTFRNVLSRSPRMADVFTIISQVADTLATVLIIGETGTGKEMIARAVNEVSSPHRTGPLITVNCAAIPESLLESELFGHEKGAFTGATTQRKGRFEQADQGTIFLDEIGDMPMAMQVKLLRVLQERKVERVGGTEAIDVNVRLVAATNQPLEKLIAEGKFREDLYYRLNVVKVELPPLRERPDDIPILAAHFVQKYTRPDRPLRISQEAMTLLESHPWPGNVRQLENAIERACVTAQGDVILPRNLPPEIQSQSTARRETAIDLSRPLPEQLAHLTAEFEDQYIRKALQETRGHVGKCAEMIGLSRRSLTDKIALYKIDKSQFKGSDGDDE